MRPNLRPCGLASSEHQPRTEQSARYAMPAAGGRPSAACALNAHSGDERSAGSPLVEEGEARVLPLRKGLAAGEW
eukprot:3997204-Amphidinium_carterae.3